jgi:multidrug efflux pump subunit AcrA (membrane-fusion protein)
MAQNGAIMILTIDGDAEYKVKVDAGKIKRLNVGEGASVKSGTTLFTVDIPLTRGDKESYAAKQAALVERLEDLTELSVAAALYAPEAGTVSNVNIASGPEVPTGPAFTINPDDRIALKVDVNELDIANVQVGFEAEIEIDAIPNEVFAGKVADVSKKSQNPEEYGASGYSVVIELERTAGMMAGMSASVTIVKEKKSDVLVIPMDAVQEMDGRLFVYTEMGETGELTGEKDIKTGLSDGTTVEVTSGLAEGDTVHYYAIPDIDGGDGTTITMG